MKKVLTLILATLLVVCSLSFVACGGPIDVKGKSFKIDKEYTTNWNYTPEEKAGIDAEMEEMVKYVYVFNEDGTGYAKINEKQQAFAFVQEGEKLTITVNGHDTVCKIDGSKIKQDVPFDMEGTKIITLTMSQLLK